MRSKRSWQRLKEEFKILFPLSKNLEKLGIDFNELTLKQMIVLFKEYPSLLRRPILIDEKRILIGFNEDEIRSFVPREFDVLPEI